MGAFQSEPWSERERKANLAALHQRLEAIRTRMDQIYEDKLDGKVGAKFWGSQTGGTPLRGQRVRRSSGSLIRQSELARLVLGLGFLKLATNAYSL
jgi:hypothetical protein